MTEAEKLLERAVHAAHINEDEKHKIVVNMHNAVRTAIKDGLEAMAELYDGEQGDVALPALLATASSPMATAIETAIRAGAVVLDSLQVVDENGNESSLAQNDPAHTLTLLMKSVEHSVDLGVTTGMQAAAAQMGGEVHLLSSDDLTEEDKAFLLDCQERNDQAAAMDFLKKKFGN